MEDKNTHATPEAEPLNPTEAAPAEANEADQPAMALSEAEASEGDAPEDDVPQEKREFWEAACAVVRDQAKRWPHVYIHKSLKAA